LGPKPRRQSGADDADGFLILPTGPQAAAFPDAAFGVDDQSVSAASRGLFPQARATFDACRNRDAA